jgi:hypothetical protein
MTNLAGTSHKNLMMATLDFAASSCTNPYFVYLNTFLLLAAYTILITPRHVGLINVFFCVLNGIYLGSVLSSAPAPKRPFGAGNLTPYYPYL